jgi:hypothetical protein
VRQFAAAELDPLPARRRGPRMQRHDGVHRLPPPFVGHADHRRLDHRGVAYSTFSTSVG